MWCYGSINPEAGDVHSCFMFVHNQWWIQYQLSTLLGAKSWKSLELAFNERMCWWCKYPFPSRFFWPWTQCGSKGQRRVKIQNVIMLSIIIPYMLYFWILELICPKLFFDWQTDGQTVRHGRTPATLSTHNNGRTPSSRNRGQVQLPRWPLL